MEPHWEPKTASNIRHCKSQGLKMSHTTYTNDGRIFFNSSYGWWEGRTSNFVSTMKNCEYTAASLSLSTPFDFFNKIVGNKCSQLALWWRDSSNIRWRTRRCPRGDFLFIIFHDFPIPWQKRHTIHEETPPPCSPLSQDALCSAFCNTARMEGSVLASPSVWSTEHDKSISDRNTGLKQTTYIII